MVATQHLQCHVRIDHLVVGVAVQQLRGAIVHHLAQQRGDRLALVEPLSSQPSQRLGRIALVERDEPRDPAIGEILVVEPVEDTRTAQTRETEHGQRPDMAVAETRFQPTGQRRVGEQGVEIDRRVRNRHNVRACRDRAVQEGQCLGVVERAHLGHEACEQIQRAVAFGDEACQRAAPIAALLGIGPLDQRPARGLGAVRGRQPGQREMVATLVMLAFIEKRGATFLIDQPRGGIGKNAVRIGRRLAPLGIEEQRPAGPEALEDIVRSRTCRNQLGFGGGFEIGATKPQHPQEAAILVEDDPGCHQCRPREVIGQPIGALAIFGEVQHVRYPFW